VRYFFIGLVLLFIGCSNKEENIYTPNNNYSYKINNTNYKTTTYKNNYSKKIKLRPYKVLGKWYYPRYVNKGEVFRGISSWYGPNFHGKRTASGEIYNMYAYTAANKIMPLGTIIKVTNLNNNKSVIVRVNDRGPFVKGRILDLSYAAGKKIGIDTTGTAPVKIVVLSTPYSHSIKKYTKTYQKPIKKEKIKHIKTIKKTANNEKNGKIKIQIGAFRNLHGAEVVKNDFAVFGKNTFIKKINGKYKVFIGDFKSYEEAINFQKQNSIKGFIIK